MDLLEERIVWLDVESTGIDPHAGEKLLQVAGIVTDGFLNEIGNPFMSKVYYDSEAAVALRESAVPFVRDMHDATRLWQTLSSEGVDLEAVSKHLLEWLRQNGVEKGKARLGGNSITLDRNFLSVFLPEVLSYLHYRSYDMTSVGGFIELTLPFVPRFEKQKTHDALDDIRESLAEARYYSAKLQELGSGTPEA